ncbi:hypothetical protein [Amphritea atlantica]|nr:hypothetical protein [Amphritea atlantica]
MRGRYAIDNNLPDAEGGGISRLLYNVMAKRRDYTQNCAMF